MLPVAALNAKFSLTCTQTNSSGGCSSNANASFTGCHRSKSQYDSLASLTVLHHSFRGWSPLISVSSSNSVASYIWKSRANNTALKPRSQARYGYRTDPIDYSEVTSSYRTCNSSFSGTWQLYCGVGNTRSL